MPTWTREMLEKLVHANLVIPANQHFIEITIPNGVSYEVFQTAAHPGWDSRNETICKNFAQVWYDEKRSAMLIVFLVVFIDLLGFGIVLPLLPRIAKSYVGDVLPASTAVAKDETTLPEHTER